MKKYQLEITVFLSGALTMVLELIASIATSLIPILETVFVNTLAQIVNQLIIVAIISATIVFGIPSFLLAAVSPNCNKIEKQ